MDNTSIDSQDTAKVINAIMERMILSDRYLADEELVDLIIEDVEHRLTRSEVTVLGVPQAEKDKLGDQYTYVATAQSDGRLVAQVYADNDEAAAIGMWLLADENGWRAPGRRDIYKLARDPTGG